ncbi:uncharacterized protein [Euphorbia lathyris]|uniref:uncharacterized protein n=1 Tax=Euphorbia lathyris TaxID=212925 RepID=UPI0033138FCA
MFGRVRASPYSLDCFDTPPSKIFKDDPLSIYEATLIKLKQGSQRDLSTLSMDVMEMASDCTTESETMESTFCSSANACETSQHLVSSSDEENMVIDTDSSSSTSILSSPSVSQSTCDSKQERGKNVSLLYLFSKYSSSRNTLNSSQGESINNGSAANSPSCSSCLSVGCTKQQSEHECHSSSSGFNM